MAFFDTISTSTIRTTTRKTFVQTVLSRLALYKQRRDLAGLSSDALQDIGVTRAQADAEATRPIWDAPEHWRD